MKLKLNDVVPLSLQLEDGIENLPKVVKAVIRERDGSLHVAQALTLTHVGDGLFKNSLLTMPSLPELTAQFFVYEADGVTLDDNYTIEFETFLLEQTETAGILSMLLRSSIIEAVPVYVEERE